MSSFRMIFIALSSTLVLQFCLSFAQTYVNHTCLGGIYTENSTFQANLYFLLSSITVNTTPNNHIFFRGSFGEDTSRVYALFQCRGDYTKEDCEKFAVFATEEIKTRCPKKKEAIISYDEFWLHYSSRSLSTAQFEPTFRRYRKVVNSTDPSGNFTPKLNKLMEQLLVKAVSVSSNLFAADSSDLSTSQKIYSLVQCIEDLPKTDCSRCLERAVSGFVQFKDKNILSMGLVFKPSCFAIFGGDQFYLIPAPAPPPPPPTAAPGQQKKSSQNIVVIVIPTLIVVLLLSMIPIALCLRRKKGSGMGKDVTVLNPVQSLQFEFSTIGAATGNFCDANKLGEGGFGSVYKGMLPDGQSIAVKRLARNSVQGGEEFKNEVVLLSRLEHRNLVKLLGFCLDGDEKLLIYEFVPNASLDQYLFAKVTSLVWETRYKIIRGIARGLLYLHEDSPYMIIHRDIKASNILLDEKMNPKISDFGMARLFMADQTQGSTNRIVGTLGYMSPEYASLGHFSVKSDVFSFGVIVLEIISGRKNTRYYESQCDEYLLSNAWKHLLEGTSLDLLEPLLGESFSPIEVKRCIHVALLCVQNDAAMRPTMASVIVMLNQNLATFPLPSSPGFFLHSAPKSAMEGMMATILDTLGCCDYESALSIITTLNRDQATLIKLKEDLENEKKLTTHLKGVVSKSDDTKTRLLKRNGDLDSTLKAREFDLNKEVTTLKAELVEENKHIEESRSQVQIPFDKLNHLLLMCDSHNKVCPNFTPQWEEYCGKYETYRDDEEAA